MFLRNWQATEVDRYRCRLKEQVATYLAAAAPEYAQTSCSEIAGWRGGGEEESNES